MSNFISSTIKGILTNGISLNLDSEEEEQYYLIRMQEYFEEETEFPAYLRKKDILEIENTDMQIAMEVTIQQSTLYILPYSQDVLEIFTEILKFISAYHVSIIEDFRGNEPNKIESISEVGKVIENYEKENQETEEDSDSDDDDFEWI